MNDLLKPEPHSAPPIALIFSLIVLAIVIWTQYKRGNYEFKWEGKKRYTDAEQYAMSLSKQQENRNHIANGEDYFDGKWYPKGSIKITSGASFAMGYDNKASGSSSIAIGQSVHTCNGDCEEGK